jgi:hypothetical protein
MTISQMLAIGIGGVGHAVSPAHAPLLTLAYVPASATGAAHS